MAIEKFTTKRFVEAIFIIENKLIRHQTKCPIKITCYLSYKPGVIYSYYKYGYAVITNV